MESTADNAPLVVMVGQTASGKSALAIEVALKYNGEIICADSRTLYRGMDIGTAKPTPLERARAPHHLLDIANPDHPITVADFKKLADSTIQDIHARGKLPILVGGTGLYIDAVIFNFSFRDQPDLKRRKELEKLSVDELQEMARTEGLPLPTNSHNPRHLIRLIETSGQHPLHTELRSTTLLLGTICTKDELVTRVTARVDAMLRQGLEEEARSLVGRFGWNCRALQTIGYQEFRSYFEGQESLPVVRSRIIQHTLQYARRQQTWFKRNKSVHWISKTEEVVDLMTTFLNK